MSSSSESTATLASLLTQMVDPARVLSRPIDRVAYASDASFYRLIPQAVVLANSADEIRSLFRFSQAHGIPLTFRTAGTSLSGQAITDGILVEVARYWREVQVEAGGKRVRVQPGVIGASVNGRLRPFGTKIGPDPASINTCMMGGILSNNSSGMCCGVSQNAYHTLQSLTFVLPSGTTIDTAQPSSDELFRRLEPELAQELLDIRQEILSTPALHARVRAKYRTKNTIGYSLNAFVDCERPVDIFQHLLIGAEGTLAFIAEAVLNTVPDLPVKYTGLLVFQELDAACRAIVPLRDAGAAALEIMDRAALRSVEDQSGVAPFLKTLPQQAAALLVEFQGRNESDRVGFEKVAGDTVKKLEIILPPLFTHDTAERNALWKIRSGMFPSVGAVRKSGTTVIIEDIGIPVEQLAEGAKGMQALFEKHGYNGIIFGHAKDGNLHFVITQSFNDQAAIDRYEQFMADVVRLVVGRFDGALKAEHGTGRNMAPFVETEWGADAYAIMWRIKRLADPWGLLNPGVIMNSSLKAHVTSLKEMPAVEEVVDKCIECGYCEPKCPSRDLTLTPRQRIVVRREMQRLFHSGRDQERANALNASFPYEVLDTCAVDGLCSTACPVGIDTGQLVKHFRKLQHRRTAQRFASLLANNFRAIERAVRSALWTGHLVQSILGCHAMTAITYGLRKIVSSDLPLWMPDVPKPARAYPTTQPSGAQAVYFPSCISRTLGNLPAEPVMSPSEAFLAVARRAGVDIYLPRGVKGTCCGVPFSSKGFDEAFQISVNRTIERFWNWSEHGKLPVIIDTTPCTYSLRGCRSSLTPVNQSRFDRLTIQDGTEFVHDWLLSRVRIAKQGPVMLHPVCSAVKLGITGKMEGIARACSATVDVPISAGCCGFAGDRGFLVPALTESATQQEANEVRSSAHESYCSSSRTCEIGLRRATGKHYQSYIYLLERATRDPGNSP